LAELEQQHAVEVEWLPYELRPEPQPLPDVTGPEGDCFRAGWQRGVAPLAEQFGIEMHFPPFKPRSRLAHEAAEFAREHGHFEAMRRALFEAFFVANRDIGRLDVLLEVGQSVGLDRGALTSALESGRYTERVVELENVSRRLGVQVVPTMVIGGLAIEGVRPYAVLRRVLEEAERRAAEEPVEQA
jgi:predicted DsbA family dithiol-disulfide isomerase